MKNIEINLSVLAAKIKIWWDKEFSNPQINNNNK